MSRIRLILFIGFAIGILPSLSTFSFAVDVQCKYTTASQLENFLVTSAQLLHRNSRIFQNHTPLQPLNQVYESIQSCQSQIEQHGMTARFTNLKNFSFDNSIHNSNDPMNGQPRTYGAFLTDREYVEWVPKDLVNLPKEFRDGLPENWREIADKNGWSYTQFDSQHVTNPYNGSRRRLTFYLEDRQSDPDEVKAGDPIRVFEQWVQFTLPMEPGVIERYIDVISIEKAHIKNGEAVELDRPRIYFAEYDRDIAGKNPKLKSKVDMPCYSCHQSGLRQFVPIPGSVPDEFKSNLKAMNSAMQDVYNVDFEVYFKPQNQGPPFGKNHCSRCHDGYEKGLITSVSAPTSSIYAKVVREFSMPPGLNRKPEFKPFFNAMDKVEPKHLAAIRERSGVDHPSHIEYLNQLRADQVLSDSEYENAKAALAALEKQQYSLYDSLMQEYAVDIKAWLEGKSSR